MKIQAALLNDYGKPFDLETVELDTTLKNTEVLVKIKATGLCHTDLTVRDKQSPFNVPAILGHEGAGIVEKVGANVTKVKPGDHVVLAPASCGKCNSCKSGHPSYCENFFPLNFGNGHREDGSCPYHNHEGKGVAGYFFGQSSFATYSLADENNVVKVPTDIPIEMLGPLGCGIQTGAGTVLNVIKPDAGQSIVISGVGPVGLSGIMAAKARGCTTIIAVDVHDNRLELAKELGATHTINSLKESVTEAITTRIHPGGVHYALDTTGRNNVISDLVASLNFTGKAVLVGVSPTANLEIPNSAFTMGRSVQFAIEGDSVPDILIPQLISLYKAGMFPFDKLIKYYDLKDINQAVEDSEKGITLKAILRMPE